MFTTVMVSHGVEEKPISVTERDKLESAKSYVTDSESFAWEDGYYESMPSNLDS